MYQCIRLIIMLADTHVDKDQYLCEDFMPLNGLNGPEVTGANFRL
jgi:hypothetical protein